ncbi:MAG TPA: hypothetical protein VMO17_02165 [Terriglobia bacterium]|nr:hypothetical protein [Terriglobia bacterium]
MHDGFLSLVAPLIGWGITAGFLFLLALPLLIGLLMGFKVLRYREWLAILAVVWSMAILVQSANYIYNLVNWSSSRFSPGMNIAVCILIFGTPLYLYILILTNSRRRVLWASAILVLTMLSLAGMRKEYAERKARDAEAYSLGMKPLSPGTGTPFVHWGRHYHGTQETVLLQGHIPEATPVVLLTDPFARPFEAQFCNGVASTYHPPAKDPAELGNVTEVGSMKGCQQRWVQGVAVLERPVTTYKVVPFQPVTGAADRRILSHPMVIRGFERFGYDPANFDVGKAKLSQAVGVGQTRLLITALQPIRTPPNAFPCADPALLISLHDPGNVKAVLPYCALGWNLFQLDGDIYFAATTQQPTPPGEEIMNPELTTWLLRVEGTELKQLWPAP